MSSTKSGPYRAAVTSSLGAGKSTMLDFAFKRGFHTLSTDAITHELLNEPNPAYDKILKRFGSQLVDKPGGPINRSKLAEIVFSDPRARKELEEHNPIRPSSPPATKESLSCRRTPSSSLKCRCCSKRTWVHAITRHSL